MNAGNRLVVDPAGTLFFQGRAYRCAIGKNGVTAEKKEGDLCTPVGEFFLRECFYRPDRFEAIPSTRLPLIALSPNDGWCDAPEDANYNRCVQLPYPASCETLWREDGIYDLVIPIGYNDDPVISGKGSAIFLHLARPDYSGTEGCVALARADLLELLPQLSPDAVIAIAV